MTFAATINVSIEHRSGPDIKSPQHIAAWLVAESAEIGLGYGYLTLRICSACPLPEECEPSGCDAPDSTFRVVIGSVDRIDRT